MNSVCLLRTQHSEISMVCMLHLLHLCDYNEEVLKNIESDVLNMKYVGE